MKYITYVLAVLLWSCFGFLVESFAASNSWSFRLEVPIAERVAIPSSDTIPLRERYGDFINDRHRNPFDLKDPKLITKEIEYDPKTQRYILTERIGSEYFRAPTYMNFEEYLAWKEKEQKREYFARLAGMSGGKNNINLREDPMDRIDVSKSLIDRLFGGTTVDIRPRGNIDLTLGMRYYRNELGGTDLRQQRNLGFLFDMGIQMSMTGKIGEKLSMDINYNVPSSFDFDRVLKLNYNTGAWTEDEIIKKIDVGNISMPLRSSLIKGNQNLFGFKTELQFGRLRTTLLASQQRSERQQLQLQGGSQIKEFEIRADQYDENRHFFLSHFNRDHFESSLSRLPQINSLFKITKIEVWVTNDRRDIENDRDIVLLADFGEFDIFNTAQPQLIRKAGITNPDITGQAELPSNKANNLYRKLTRNIQDRELTRVNNFITNTFGMQQSRDFEKVRARLLNRSEYTFHPDLGFISLSISLRPNQVLGVAYEYTYNGKTYQVGEFAEEVPEDPDKPGVLFVKMLKSTTARVDLPIWDLMMKNFYSIGAYQVSNEDFEVDFFYEGISGVTTQEDDFSDRRNLPGTNLANRILLELLNLDNLNSQRDPQPDGRFDFVPGLTINTTTGRIMIPRLEPFGQYLEQALLPEFHDQFVYNQLYDSTITAARDFTELNRYIIKGRYKSNQGSNVQLGSFNVPRGSVRVSAGGQLLREGTDYTVDYNTGNVILNESIRQSGVPVNIEYEDQSLFSFQTKTMLGVRADYEFSDKLNLGATYMRLFERPFTQKVNIGNDPINNRVWGLDLNYNTESKWLTRMVDKIPLISTKEKSSFNLSAEVASMDPGHSSAIENEQNDGGIVYIDDFEGTAGSEFTLANWTNWTISSVPTDMKQGGGLRFRESELSNDIRTGVNRAAISFYQADRSVLSTEDANNPYCRVLQTTELFTQRQTNNLLAQVERTFDVHYDPTRRGPYNFDPPQGTEYSAGSIDPQGSDVIRLKDPSSRWGGIMRFTTITDFEQSNVEFIEFWVLNPYIGRPNAKPGKLILQLGNISEDIMKDSRFFFENGLGDTSAIDQTAWGKVPSRPPIVNAFDNDPAVRVKQDVGLDGLTDAEELNFYSDYVNSFTSGRTIVAQDPSNDNYVFYNDARYTSASSCIDRYSRFNYPQGDSPNTQDITTNLRAQKLNPDIEDLDRDNTLNESESYYSYEITLNNQNGQFTPHLGPDPNTNYIIDQRVVPPYNSEPGADDGIWYQVRIPIRSEVGRQIVGGIRDFRSIRFLRMYLTDFDEPVTLRFARFDLLRSQWRRYLLFENTCGGLDGNGPTLDVNSVSLEENSDRLPFNYVLPKGIQRERSFGSFQTNLQNEESLSLNACGLNADNCEVGAYKIVNFDLRLYKRLQMFIHAEHPQGEDIPDKSVELFLRIGSDLKNNYYEISQPLVFSKYDVASPYSSENIWPEENQIDVLLQDLVDAKSNGSDNPNIRVVGLPNLADARNIMIGVRSKTDATQNTCINVWANELRVSGIDERGGMAGLVRMDAQLADLGSVGAALNYSGIGYGGIDQSVYQRQREDILGYDLTTNLEIGKFFPKSLGIKIPFYAQYSVAQRSPLFDPYDEDVEFKTKLEGEPDPVKKKEIKDRAINYERITSFNFTNVRIEGSGKKKPKPWSPSNVSVSYSVAKELKHNPVVASDEQTTTRAGLNYNYNFKGLPISPFKKLIKKKSKMLRWMREINLNPIPNNFSFGTSVDRRFGSIQYRSLPNRMYFNKFFNWDRNYNMRWDLTKSLKLSYNATNRGIVDEPNEQDLVDQFPNDPLSRAEVRKDSIWSNLKNFGRTKNYSHTIDANYTLPLKYLPYLDFINARASYAAGYDWNAASQNVLFLGNTIQNNQKRTATVDMNFTKLYKKSKYLKRLENPNKKTSARKKRGGASAIDDENKKNKSAKDEKPPKTSGKKGDKKEKKKKKKGERPISTIEKLFVRPLLSLRKIQFNYTRDFRSYVPGFTPEPEYFGLGEELTAPGVGYILGLQPDQSWLFDVAQQKGWITDNIELNEQFLLSDRENTDLRISLEPFKDLKIDLNWKKTAQNTHTENFKKQNGSEWRSENPRDIGSYTVSYFMANTLFGRNVRDVFDQFAANRTLISKRLGTINGITEVHPLDGPEYVDGFGRLQVDVVIPSFLAAYTDQDPNQIDLDVFKVAPRPNWNLRWDASKTFSFLKNVFNQIAVTHGYGSNFTINSYNSNFDFVPDPNLRFAEVNRNRITQNFFSVLDIPNIDIQEQFSPLLGIDMTTKTGANIRLNYKKSRRITLSLRESGEVRETKSTDFTFGFGHTIKNVRIGFLQFDAGTKRTRKRKSRQKRKEEEELDKKLRDAADDINNKGGKIGPKKKRRKKEKKKGSDLVLAFDVSFRDDLTITHELDTGTDPQPSRGQKTLRIEPTIDYDINKNLTLRLFFEYNSTRPYTSDSAPTVRTRGGINFRFKLQ